MIFGLLSSTGRHQTSASTVPALYKCRISDVVEGRFVLHRLHWLRRLRTPTICRRSKLSRPQGAMQAFLVYREDSSHEARSTKKQIYVNSFRRISEYSSHCPRCHNKRSLLNAACHFIILKLLFYGLDLC